MSRGRAAGTKNRNYPPLPLKRALTVARAIEHDASGMKTSRLTLAELVNTTPTSRVFKELIASSRFYGLTTGGINADEFELTELGGQAASDDPEVCGPALKSAVMNVPPYQAFFDKFNGKKVPSEKPMTEFLTRDAGVDGDRADEAAEYILSDGKAAGLTRKVKNADPAALPDDEEIDDAVDDEPAADDVDEDGDDVGPEQPAGGGDARKVTSERRSRPNAIFVGHGKNKKPRDQLTKILGEYSIPYKVAEDEPNRGRPIPIKVKETMEECRQVAAPG